MKKLKIIVILLFIASLSQGQSNFMKNELSNNKNTSLSEFVNNYPFDQYLKNIRFTDFQTLQKDRLLLWKEKGDGDIFLYYLGQKFIEKYPVNYNDIEIKTKIGEAYLNNNKGNWNQQTDEIYKIIGYYILGRVGSKIEEGIKSENLNKKSPEIQNIISRLENRKIYISIEGSKSAKVWDHLKEYDFGFLIDRLSLEFQERFSKEKKTKPLNSHNYNSNIKFITVTTYLKTTNNDNAISIYKMLENNTVVGHCIWLSRPQLKATYIAYQNVYNKFTNLKRNQNIYLAATGGYTNVNHQPEGLTVENGNIVNATIMHDREGLVLVEKNGGIRVLNLENKNFLLPYGGPQIKNPLDNLIAFSQLLNWCKTKKATLFQTHLLAFSDSILISSSKASKQLRERRLLVLVSDLQTKNIHHVIFDFTSPYDLTTVTNEIYALMKKRKKKVEAILNLDVGSFNIMQVYDLNGNIILNAPVPILNATNLLIYSTH